MASRLPPLYANYEADSRRPRDGQNRAPTTVHHYAQPVFNNPRRTSGDADSVTIPRSQRRSETQYHDDARYGQSSRADIRYGGSGQQSYNSSRYTSAPLARPIGRSEFSDRSFEGNRDERRRTYRAGQAEDIDETGSDLTGSVDRRDSRDDDAVRSMTSPRRPSNTHRSSQVSFGSDTASRHYTHTGQGKHDTGRRDDDDVQEDTSHARNRRDSYGRTERSRPIVEEQRPGTVHMDSGHSQTTSRSHAEDRHGSRGDVSRSSAASKRYHQEPGRIHPPSSPSHPSPEDPKLTTGRHRDNRVQQPGRDNYLSRPDDKYERPQPPPSTTSRNSRFDEQTSNTRTDPVSHRDNRFENMALDTEHVWQPWEVSKKGRRYRVASFEGKIKLIQLDDSAGPYCDVNNEPVDPARALKALKFISDRLSETSARPVKAREPLQPAARRPNNETCRDRDKSDSDLEETQTPHGCRETHRESHSHQTRKEHRHGHHDDEVDRLGHDLESTGLRTEPEPRRGMMLRRTDDGDVMSGTAGLSPRAGLSNRGDGPNDDDDILPGTFGAKNTGPPPQNSRRSILVPAREERMK